MIVESFKLASKKTSRNRFARCPGMFVSKITLIIETTHMERNVLIKVGHFKKGKKTKLNCEVFLEIFF